MTFSKILDKLNTDPDYAFELAFLPPEELNTSKWTHEISRIKMNDDKIKNLPTVTWKPCKVCKENKYFFNQLQTRSGDEPITTFYTCKICNKLYKICG
jgi:DNA-directed RNA polymerase subunit M/transcription elongation factor TFIIS